MDECNDWDADMVSIQLVSPARGEPIATAGTPAGLAAGFPFNWFPLREGNFRQPWAWLIINGVSIQLVSPARGEPVLI